MLRLETVCARQPLLSPNHSEQARFLWPFQCEAKKQTQEWENGQSVRGMNGERRPYCYGCSVPTLRWQGKQQTFFSSLKEVVVQLLCCFLVVWFWGGAASPAFWSGLEYLTTSLMNLWRSSRAQMKPTPVALIRRTVMFPPPASGWILIIQVSFFNLPRTLIKK